MAQVLAAALPYVKKACGGTESSKIFAAIGLALNPISIPNWIVYLVVLFSIHASATSFLNSTQGNKTWARSALSAFIIYLLVMIAINRALIGVICGAASIAP